MPGDTSSTELREFLEPLWRKKPYIIAVAAVALAAGLFYSHRQTPLYAASAEVLVRPVNLDPTESSNDVVDINTEIQIANSAVIQQQAAKQLSGEGIAPAGVSVGGVSGTNALTFNATSSSPRSAQATAQAFASSYLLHRRNQVLQDVEAARQPIEKALTSITGRLVRVQQELSTATTPSSRTALTVQLNALNNQSLFLLQRLNQLVLPENVRVGEILAPAGLPTAPFSPDHRKTALFSLFAGLVLGIGIAMLLDRFDPRLRDRSDLEYRASTTVLGSIPTAKRRDRRAHVLYTISRADSHMADAYRTLRASVLAAARRQAAKTISVTSAGPREGKTTTAANLAVALAQAGSRTILISADLRQPRVQRFFDSSKPNDAGLRGVLAEGHNAQKALLQVFVNLRVMLSGPTSPNPDSLIGSSAMQKVIDELARDADFLILDSPPVLGNADGVALAPLADAVLLVTDARQKRGMVEEARNQLHLVGARVMGAVLTNARHHPRMYSYYGDRGSHGRPSTDAP
jgi:succinoglycan biosynthesis transport protein ExoP